MPKAGGNVDERLAAARRSYGADMQAASGSADRRIGEAFAGVPREDYLPPPPWQAQVAPGYPTMPTDDPVALYRDVLVAIDPARGINNGQPSLHAGWIGAVAPRPGESVTQIGAGTGYYTAILARLVGPDGHVSGYEVEPDLAAMAKRNCADDPAIEIIAGSAATDIPRSDIVYVNAGVMAPPPAWLSALKPGGRLVFPWRPTEKIGLAMIVKRLTHGFSAEPISGAWFIPCVGTEVQRPGERAPSPVEARAVRSAHLSSEGPPDDTAVAIYPGLWFSTREAGKPRY